MIERLALVIIEAIADRDEDGNPAPYMSDYEPKTKATEMLLIEGDIMPTAIARAVLTALREPTEAMLSNKALFHGSSNDSDGFEVKPIKDRDHAALLWRHMIDVALNDKVVDLPHLTQPTWPGGFQTKAIG
ncbi:hypothetical protein [Novosphingobium terrae]|uniref:hypothetical protein n=1 Tax=Novosphingobium terrae TaxID=2726189 RepID=UPI0019818EB5|nr:hypothetical protein [Novosphingobium terrae]